VFDPRGVDLPTGLLQGGDGCAHRLARLGLSDRADLGLDLNDA
jgi:hypothetical protein